MHKDIKSLVHFCHCDKIDEYTIKTDFVREKEGS